MLAWKYANILPSWGPTVNPTRIHDLTLTFPAIQGIQAARAYYVAMVRLNDVVRLIDLDREDLPPELRVQRILNKGRVPAIKSYLLSNRKSYVLSSITASVGGEVQFEPLADDPVGRRLGKLSVSAGTVVINDGQHRRAAIAEALLEAPELGRETVSVVLFVDANLERSQQRFADLNRYSVRPAKSISVLYDHRDPLGQLVTQVVSEVPTLHATTEKMKTTISNRSRTLFTLSSLYQATRALLSPYDPDNLNGVYHKRATDFWSEVVEQFPDWKKAAEGKLHAADLRANYVHAHGVTIQAIAQAGAELIDQYPNPIHWKKRLSRLQGIDWKRSNTEFWEGRALQNGRMSKSYNSIARTANVIKQQLGLKISEANQEIEDCHGS